MNERVEKSEKLVNNSFEKIKSVCGTHFSHQSIVCGLCAPIKYFGACTPDKADISPIVHE
jgi:hypothetical protein